MCKFFTKSDAFTSTDTGETFKIINRFDCNDKSLNKLFNSSKCKKQYTGQTADHFCSRWNNCKSKSRSFDRGEQFIQEHLYKHFESKNNSVSRDDVSSVLIDKIDGSNRLNQKYVACK